MSSVALYLPIVLVFAIEEQNFLNSLPFGTIPIESFKLAHS